MGAQNNSSNLISFIIVCLIAVSLLEQASAIAQDPYANPNQSPSLNDVKIIPPSPDAIGGGNPLQGLGRSDESSPSRRSQFESSDSIGSSNPSPGSVNPNVPPDLPPAPITDPIELQ